MDSCLNIPNFSIIVAISENNVIGIGGYLPWNLKTDLKRFAERTEKHMVIVGRKTNESIMERLGHPLVDRTTVVVSRELYGETRYANQYLGCFCPWKEALFLARQRSDEVFVIGGAEIYKLALLYTNTIYLTRVHAVIAGDAFFPKVDPEEWEETAREKHKADAKNSHDFSFITLKRRNQNRQFVSMTNARLDEQRKVMEEILKQGLCPFCWTNLQKFHKKPILKETLFWRLTENQWPYENTKVHLLAIYKHHVESLNELNPVAGEELFWLAQRAERKYKLKGGALSIGMRFGDPEASGATVKHIHAQLMAAEITDKADPKYKPIRFRAG